LVAFLSHRVRVSHLVVFPKRSARFIFKFHVCFPMTKNAKRDVQTFIENIRTSFPPSTRMASILPFLFLRQTASR
jgi:hypothetical protein